LPSRHVSPDRLPAGIWKVACVATLGSLMAQIDATVVNVSLSSLAASLHSSLATIQWVTSGYLLALALMLPLSGWLVDRIGARSLYLWCFSAFIISSALCGLAWSAGSLIGFRILQGMAGGLMAPMAQMIMARAAGRHMAKVFGYMAIPVLLGPIMGPVLAGAILQHLTWRWLFLVNVPVGVLALALAVLFIPEDDALIQRRTFDLPGFLILAPALVLFLYGADNILDHSGQLCFAIAIVMIIVFARGALRKGPKALLDLRLFRSGVFPVSARTQFLQNGIVYATQMLLPLYLIKACGRTPGEVGVLLLPLGLGMLAGYPSIGWLTKHFGIRNVAAGGSLISLLSALPFLYLADHRMVGPIFIVSLLLRGIGQGAIGVPSLSAAYSGVPKQEIPMATTTLNIVQRLGGPTLTTLMAAFLAGRMHFAVSADDVSRAFMLSFLALAVLHVLLLVSTLRLPRVLPKASEVTC
jgi:EmrB/QacA subfamily drug resistance transporter